jgi:hypothetical protein
MFEEVRGRGSTRDAALESRMTGASPVRFSEDSAPAGARADEAPDSPDTTYARLSAPFETVYQRPSGAMGGEELLYISGEQVVSRLNEVLGVSGWSFRILHQEIHAEADEVWALGEMVAEIDGKTVTRQQFGSQKVKRSRSTGAPLDLGFDLKGAATDAMKKCASLLGVGLYLSRKPVPRAPAPRPYTAARDARPDVRPGGAARGAGEARALASPARGRPDRYAQSGGAAAVSARSA